MAGVSMYLRKLQLAKWNLARPKDSDFKMDINEYLCHASTQLLPRNVWVNDTRAHNESCHRCMAWVSEWSDRSIDWLYWLVDWLIDWLVNWLFHCLADVHINRCSFCIGGVRVTDSFQRDVRCDGKCHNGSKRQSRVWSYLGAYPSSHNHDNHGSEDPPIAVTCQTQPFSTSMILVEREILT